MKDNHEEVKDELENFVFKNRGGFDDLSPRENTWTTISKELDKEKANYSWLWKVAALLFLGLSIALLIEKNTTNDIGVAINDIPKVQEWQHAEGYYTQLISQKRMEIKMVIDKNNFTDLGMVSDLDQLDVMYNQLKVDLDLNQNDQRVISAMIRNLQLRVEILNKQLKILENITKYQEHEKISV